MHLKCDVNLARGRERNLGKKLEDDDALEFYIEILDVCEFRML